jgi:hypothetical protein
VYDLDVYDQHQGDERHWIIRSGAGGHHTVDGGTTDSTLTIRVTDLDGKPAENTRTGFLVALGWSSDDPFTTTMQIHDESSDSASTWMFARELLLHGGGVGDVRIEHGEVTTITLDTPTGHAEIGVPRHWALAIADLTQQVIPLGQEPSLADLSDAQWHAQMPWLSENSF